MEDDAWSARRSHRPAPPRHSEPGEPSGVRVTGIDVPFVQLTLFFVKASLAAAVALTLTSVVWLGVGGLFAGMGTGVWFAVTAVQGATEPTVVPGTPPAPVVVVAPAPAPAPVPPPVEAPPVVEPVVEAPPVAEAAPSEPAPARPKVDKTKASNDATDALIRKQLEERRGN